jgi:DNA-binding NarL/FixJ family response regulator
MFNTITTKIKIFIVDDHSLIAEGLRAAFMNEQDLEFVGSCLDGKSCFTFLSKNEVDVILMDVHLPDINGIDLCADVLKLYPVIKILGLSTSHQRTYVSKMMENGARGYILKNSRIDEIQEAVRQAYKGNIFLSKEAGNALYKTQPSSNDEIQLLTVREKEVLKYISEGFAAPKIADKMFISQLTVESHRRNLMAKLKAKNTALLIKIAMANNLI